jgi:hypothetical protein
MSVKASELENAERDLDLSARDEGRARQGRKREEAVAGDAADLVALRELRHRFDAAKVEEPKDPQPHCRACFVRGWMQALKKVEG